LEDAARRQKGTAAQVEFGRALDKAYGKYSKHGPHMRDTILHTTPFIPWFLNMGRFLTETLPKEHPVKAALLADLNHADLEWRKKHRLSFYGDHVPDFLMGAAPRGDRFVPAGRFGPFAPGDVVGSLGGQVYPQIAGALLNAAGVDWTGRKLPGGQGRRASNVALTEAEALIPGVAQGARISGLENKVRGKKLPPGEQKSAKQRAIDIVNPLRSIGVSGGGSEDASSGVRVRIKPVKVKPVRVKPVRVKPVK
jgi:hypothetical protein